MASSQVVLHVVGILEGLAALRTGHRGAGHSVTDSDVFGQIQPGDEGATVGTVHAAACNRTDTKLNYIKQQQMARGRW
jgi:hypothetical protein